MAKEDGQSSQLNLTVVALVALVAIVGLVALVLNTASLAKISTGGQIVSAQYADDADANIAGQPTREYTPGSLESCAQTAYCRCRNSGYGPLQCAGWCGACPGTYDIQCRTC